MNNNFSMVTEPESIGHNMVIGVVGLIEVHMGKFMQLTGTGLPIAYVLVH